MLFVLNPNMPSFNSLLCVCPAAARREVLAVLVLCTLSAGLCSQRTGALQPWLWQE